MMAFLLDAQFRFFGLWNDWRARHPGLMLGADLLVLCAIFVLLRKPSIMRTRLLEEEYGGPRLFTALFRRSSRATVAAIALVPLILGWGRLGWDSLAHAETLRWFIVLTAFPLAWQFGTYALNYYYGRSHWPDRILIAALMVGLAWHPGFAPPLLLMALVIYQQFNYPIPRHYRWTDKVPLIEILLMFEAFLLARLIVGPVSTLAFAVAAFCIPASSYFASGVIKIRYDWMRHERLSYLYAAACQNGWHCFLTREQQYRFAAALDRQGPALKWATLIIEIGFIVALVHPGVTAIFLVAMVGLHLGIFISSGILFWKWIIVDLALIPLLFAVWDGVGAGGVPAFAPLVYSMAIILIAPRLWTVKKLGWVDSQFFGVYRFEVVLDDGRIRTAAPAHFEPWDFPMTQGRLHFLHANEDGIDKDKEKEKEKEKKKGVDYTLMLDLKTEEQIAAARRAFRGIWGSANRTRQFDKLMRRTFLNRNRLRSRRHPLARRLMAPQHVWSYPVGETPWDGEGVVRAVRVRYIELLFNDGDWRTLSDEVIREVEIAELP